jgi:hypothetical protein
MEEDDEIDVYSLLYIVMTNYKDLHSYSYYFLQAVYSLVNALQILIKADSRILFMNNRSDILIILFITCTTIAIPCVLTTNLLTVNLALAVGDNDNNSNFSSVNETSNKISGSSMLQKYNATDSLISTINSSQNLLSRALNDIHSNNTQTALIDLNNLKTKIEQYQLSALDLLSNPILQSSITHLNSAQDAIKSGNIETAISELSIVGQLRLQHNQGMMKMKLPMKGELNSTFNSLESHLLAANEAVNANYTQKAISEVNMAKDQLFVHQLSMIDFISSLFNNTRTHLKQSMDDIKNNDKQGAISELNIVEQLLNAHQRGILVMIGMPKVRS